VAVVNATSRVSHGNFDTKIDVNPLARFVGRHFQTLLRYGTLVLQAIDLMYTEPVKYFIHLLVCLTTGPKPLPKRALHIVRSRASSFK
jgi:hypothetical protein